MLKNALIVGLGGALGTILRFLISHATKNVSPYWLTLFINLAGCFLIGLLFGLFKTNELGPTQKLFLTTGFCGGFTTFSAFSLENIQLMQEGKYPVALLYTALSIIGGFSLTFAGYKLFHS
jgi:CrcB protein